MLLGLFGLVPLFCGALGLRLPGVMLLPGVVPGDSGGFAPGGDEFEGGVVEGVAVEGEGADVCARAPPATASPNAPARMMDGSLSMSLTSLFNGTEILDCSVSGLSRTVDYSRVRLCGHCPHHEQFAAPVLRAAAPRFVAAQEPPCYFCLSIDSRQAGTGVLCATGVGS